MPDSDRGAGFKVVTALFSLAVAGLLVALIFHLGWKNGNAEGEYKANTDTYAKHAQDEIEDCFALTDGSSVPECVRNVVKAQNEHERAEADLVAQTEMGLWALGMLIVSTLMMLVSALGVWWIRDTLLETRKAVKAADDAVTVTREMAQAQTRAYLSPPNLRFQNTEVFRDRSNVIKVAFIETNSGMSPAEKIVREVDWLSYDVQRDIVIDHHPGFDLPNSAFGTQVSGGAVNEESAAFLQGNLSHESIGLTEWSRIRIIFTVRRRYSDVFGRSYNEEFSYISNHVIGRYEVPMRCQPFALSCREFTASPIKKDYVLAAVPDSD